MTPQPRRDAARRFAALVEADRAEIVSRCEGAPPEAGEVLDDVVAGVRDGAGRGGGRTLSECFARWAARRLRDDPGLAEPFATALAALNESLERRHVARTRQEERRRIARELHDRLGEELTVALRRIELRSLMGGSGSDAAEQAIVGAMDRLREITSELVLEPVTDLREALREHVVAVADPRLRLWVAGEGDHAPPEVLTEAFFVLRQAVRNAIAHGDASRIVVEVDVGTRLLRGRVSDDGRGFTGEPGVGITSMRERAESVGGTVTIEGGRGTCVELRVPLC
ncbi:sensor histidine kinase [Actinomadura rubrisoli]|uniref:Histidine kinase/HSP90-like ATPase domain-containing protein n=1 Tax=Actinomadura rubrisoli TaxID=2530368 RepID=A0A4R5C3W2_9ACTN|nr:ATP-binding protein [Actinomadura rubrisoli]TDD91492.1 hypothetical protein E1298_11925 [Actinomadura rubrisoli]